MNNPNRKPDMTEAQIYEVQDAIRKLREAEATLVRKLEEARLSAWALNVIANGARSSLTTQIEDFLNLELPRAVERREQLKAVLRAPLGEVVQTGVDTDATQHAFDIRTVDADLLEN